MKIKFASKCVSWRKYQFVICIYKKLKKKKKKLKYSNTQIRIHYTEILRLSSNLNPLSLLSQNDINKSRQTVRQHLCFFHLMWNWLKLTKEWDIGYNA